MHGHSSNDSVMKLDSDRTSGKPYHIIVTISTIWKQVNSISNTTLLF